MATAGTLQARRTASLFGVSLLLLAALVAWPEFAAPQAAAPFGHPAFAQQWSAAETAAPNFWGPALQPALKEAYRESPGGSRLVQYFDKARMEQTTADGAVTNGLLTVELITGKRQVGDTTFETSVPSSLAIVGDMDNAWPPYAALGGSVFAAKVARSDAPVGLVYKADGTFAANPGLGAQPGSAFGAYQSDPGGTYGHNIPAALWSYLSTLPVAWQTAMGYPLTEAFWVNVRVASVPTWVMVQPFERRVLSYTPTNPRGFQVEMGNIGQHYYLWRYGQNSGAVSGSTTGSTTAKVGTGTTATGTLTGTRTGTASVTAQPSGTATALAITSVNLGTVTDTTFALSFRTTIAATSQILYGATSHSYANQQEIATTATQEHSVTLTDLDPGKKYYFALRVVAGDASVQRKEDYFSTIANPVTANTNATATSVKATRTPTASATTTVPATVAPTAEASTATPKPTSTPLPTATPVPKNIQVVLSQVVIGARNDVQITALQTSGVRITVTLAYESGSGNASGSPTVANWSRDPANATTTGSGAGGPVALTDKQTPVTVTISATIPFTDPTSPPIAVTFKRTLTPAEYAAGGKIASDPLSNAKSPEYSVVVSFTPSVG